MSNLIIKTVKYIFASSVLFVFLFTGCVFKKDVNYTNVEESFPKGSVNKIEIILSCGNFNISLNENNEFTVDAKNVPDDFKTAIENDTFIIDFNNKKGYDLKQLKKADVSISIPSIVYDDVKIQIGDANGEISELNCSCLDIECGKASLSINNLITEKNAEFECGIGTINVSDSALGGLDVNQAAGSFKFYGSINGDVSIESGLGSVKLSLTNDRDEFKQKYKLDIKKPIKEVDVSFNN